MSTTCSLLTRTAACQAASGEPSCRSTCRRVLLRSTSAACHGGACLVDQDSCIVRVIVQNHAVAVLGVSEHIMTLEWNHYDNDQDNDMTLWYS